MPSSTPPFKNLKSNTYFLSQYITSKYGFEKSSFIFFLHASNNIRIFSRNKLIYACYFVFFICILFETVKQILALEIHRNFNVSFVLIEKYSIRFMARLHQFILLRTIAVMKEMRELFKRGAHNGTISKKSFFVF